MTCESILQVLLTGDSLSAYAIMRGCRRQSGRPLRTSDFWIAMADLESRGLVRRIQRWRGSTLLRPQHEITDRGRWEIENTLRTRAPALGVHEAAELKWPPAELR